MENKTTVEAIITDLTLRATSLIHPKYIKQALTENRTITKALLTDPQTPNQQLTVLNTILKVLLDDGGYVATINQTSINGTYTDCVEIVFNFNTQNYAWLTHPFLSEIGFYSQLLGFWQQITANKNGITIQYVLYE